MAIQQKEMADVAPNNGYSRAQYTATDFSPLAQGIQSFGRDLGEAIRRSKVAENVQLVVNQGLREMQEVTAEYNALKGEMGWSQQVFDQYQDKLKRIFEKRMADARTDDGRDEIMARLDAYRTQSYGNMYQTHLQRVDAKFISDTNAELSFAENNVRSSSDAETFQFNLHNVIASLSTLADHQGLSDRQRQNLFQDAQNKMLLSAMQGIQGRDSYENSTYEEAKQFLEFARQTYGGADTGVSDGRTSSGITFGAMAQIVDKLRRRKSALQLALEYNKKHKNREAIVNAIRFHSLDSKEYKEIEQLAKDNGLEVKDFLAAGQEYSNRIRHQQAIDNTGSLDRAWAIFNDSKDENGQSYVPPWGVGEIQEIYERLMARGRNGDSDALQKAMEIARWWKQVDEVKRAAHSHGIDIDQQIFYADLVWSIKSDPNFLLSDRGNVGAFNDYLRAGKISVKQHNDLVSLIKGDLPDAIKNNRLSINQGMQLFDVGTKYTINDVYDTNHTYAGDKKNDTAREIGSVVSSVRQALKIKLDIASNKYGGHVPWDVFQEAAREANDDLVKQLSKFNPDDTFFKKFYEFRSPKTFNALSPAQQSELGDIIRTDVLRNRDGSFVGNDAAGHLLTQYPKLNSDDAGKAAFWAFASDVGKGEFEKFLLEHPELVPEKSQSNEKALIKRREKAIIDFAKQHGIDSSDAQVIWNSLSGNSKLQGELIELIKGVK